MTASDRTLAVTVIAVMAIYAALGMWMALAAPSHPTLDRVVEVATWSALAVIFAGVATAIAVIH